MASAHSLAPKGTLVVKRIINLTNAVLVIYDHAGNIVTLHPEKIRLRHGELPIIGDNTFIVVDDSTDEKLVEALKKSHYYKDRLATPRPMGKIRGNYEGHDIIALRRSERTFFVTLSSNPRIPSLPVMVDR